MKATEQYFPVMLFVFQHCNKGKIGISLILILPLILGELETEPKKTSARFIRIKISLKKEF